MNTLQVEEKLTELLGAPCGAAFMRCDKLGELPQFNFKRSDDLALLGNNQAVAHWREQYLAEKKPGDQWNAADFERFIGALKNEERAQASPEVPLKANGKIFILTPTPKLRRSMIRALKQLQSSATGNTPAPH